MQVLWGVSVIMRKADMRQGRREGGRIFVLETEGSVVPARHISKLLGSAEDIYYFLDGAGLNYEQP